MESAYKSKFNERALRNSFNEALGDQDFKKLVKEIGATDGVAMKYTSSLENTVKEMRNCQNCDGLIYCKNRLEGFLLYPELLEKQIIFSYVPCRYRKEQQKALELKGSQDKEIEQASMALIFKDKERIKVIKWMKNFYDTYKVNGKNKGLYLHGNFGCGKTYLISALFNEMKKKRVSSEIVYFPELLRDMKSDFETFSSRIAYLENVDLLLIDDIGAEKVTEWGRDEVLGTILQKRMNNYKTTFFTSNFDIQNLERHLSLASNSVDEVKARRIIMRIKQLTDDIELIGENKRN